MSRIAFRRSLACSRQGSAVSRAVASRSTVRGQDKGAHIVLRSVGCFRREIWCFPHIALPIHNVRINGIALKYNVKTHLAEHCDGR